MTETRLYEEYAESLVAAVAPTRLIEVYAETLVSTPPAVFVNLADTAAGSDAAVPVTTSSTARAEALTDTATGADALSTSSDRALALIDVALGSDALVVAERRSVIADVASGADVVTVAEKRTRVTDTATGSDTVGVGEKRVTLTDTAVGSDALFSSMVAIHDTAFGTDLMAAVQTGDKVVTLADTAVGDDDLLAEQNGRINDFAVGTDQIIVDFRPGCRVTLEHSRHLYPWTEAGTGPDPEPEPGPDPEPARLLSRQNVAVIGDGRIADTATALRAALVAAGYGDGNVWTYGVHGKTTASTDANGKTLATNIADARDYFGGDPDAWVIAVGSPSAVGTVPSEMTQPLLAVQETTDRRLLWLSHSAAAFNTAAAPLVNAKPNAVFATTTSTDSALVDFIVDAVGPPTAGADGGWTKAQLLNTPPRAGATITDGARTWNTVTYEATYVSGDTFQQTLNRVTGGRILTLPEGVFTIPNFTNGFNDGVRIGSGGATGCIGIAGSGRGTIIRLTGSGSTGGNIIGVDRLGAGPAYFGNFQLQADDRSAAGWTGIFIDNAPGTLVEWLYLNGASKGYANYPPGETFGINISHSNDAVVRDTEVDGRNRTSRVRQAASPMGWNGSAGTYVQNAKVARCYVHHSLTSMATFWQTHNVDVDRLHSWSDGSGSGLLSGSQINLEEVTGQVRLRYCRLYAYGSYYKANVWPGDPYATGNVDFMFAQASTTADMTDIIVTEPRFDLGFEGFMTVVNYSGYQNSTTSAFNVITTPPVIIKNGITLTAHNHSPSSWTSTADVDHDFAWVR